MLVNVNVHTERQKAWAVVGSREGGVLPLVDINMIEDGGGG